MTTTQAVNWFTSQPSASLTNALSRAYLAELLNDPVNAQTTLTQRVPLQAANRLEVAEIEAITTLYTPILGRLNVNWLNPLEQSYLADIAGDTLYSVIDSFSPLVWLRFLETSGAIAANSGSASLSGTYGGGVTLNQTAPRSDIKALLFDGTDDFVSIPSNASINQLTAATYGFLVNPSSAGEGSAGRFYGSASQDYLRFNTSLAVVQAVLDGVTGDGISTTSAGLTAGQWAWVFQTYDINGDAKSHIYKGQSGVVSEFSYSQHTAATGGKQSNAVTRYLGNTSSQAVTFDGLYASPFILGYVLTSAEMLAIVTASGV